SHFGPIAFIEAIVSISIAEMAGRRPCYPSLYRELRRSRRLRRATPADGRDIGCPEGRLSFDGLCPTVTSQRSQAPLPHSPAASIGGPLWAASSASARRYSTGITLRNFGK